MTELASATMHSARRISSNYRWIITSISPRCYAIGVSSQVRVVRSLFIVAGDIFINEIAPLHSVRQIAPRNIGLSAGSDRRCRRYLLISVYAM